MPTVSTPTPTTGASSATQRAHSVLKYLVDKGVEEKRLTAQGYGETQPIDRRHNEAAWAKNRRVAFLILKRAAD